MRQSYRLALQFPMIWNNSEWDKVRDPFLKDTLLQYRCMIDIVFDRQYKNHDGCHYCVNNPRYRDLYRELMTEMFDFGLKQGLSSELMNDLLRQRVFMTQEQCNKTLAEFEQVYRIRMKQFIIRELTH